MYNKTQQCCAAYVKLLGEEHSDLRQLSDTTPFSIMFGPDQCGSKKTIQFIYQFRSPVTGTWNEVQANELAQGHSLPLFENARRSHMVTLGGSPWEPRGALEPAGNCLAFPRGPVGVSHPAS